MMCCGRTMLNKDGALECRHCARKPFKALHRDEIAQYLYNIEADIAELLQARDALLTIEPKLEKIGWGPKADPEEMEAMLPELNILKDQVKPLRAIQAVYGVIRGFTFWPKEIRRMGKYL